jgi:hypothetical protein
MSRNWNRDEPEMDAEDYVSRKQSEVGTCECCNMPIYKGLSYINIHGVLIHDEIECIVDYMKQFKEV